MKFLKNKRYLLLINSIFLVLILYSKNYLTALKLSWFFILVTALLISCLITPLVRIIATKIGAMDIPDERKIHKKPVPRLGGLAIYIALIISIMLNFHFSLALKGVVVGGSIIFIMGAIDDIKGLKASIRLIGQLIAVMILIKCGVVLNTFPHTNMGYIWNILLTIFWVIGIINALNFLDGMDGLAAGITAISSFMFFIIALSTGQHYLGYLAIALIGACIGFLFYNFKPASIFLGDSGSTLLGFLLASFAIMGWWAEKNILVALGIPVLILSVLIFDMIYITVSRIASGKVKNFREWIEYTGQDHLHHRLSNLGLSEKQTVLTIYLISFILGITTLVLRNANKLNACLLLLQAILIFVLIAILMKLGKKKAS